MLQRIYLNLLILCCIFCHGIIATLSDEVTRNSSDSLVRKRRVISHVRGVASHIPIENANYMVNIRENNRVHCAGVILSHYTVITAALCVSMSVSNYLIFASSAYEAHSKVHHVTSKEVYFGAGPHQEHEGIALITADPPFEYYRKTGNIELYVGGPLPTGTLVTVYGWGYQYPIPPGSRGPRRLRYIHLPIMNHAECQNTYRNSFTITDKHVCTYCPQQYCAFSDAGAPLVVNDTLAGIHVWKGVDPRRRNPDVFINLQRNDYRSWINDHTLLM